ncbi:MAG: hypothetical protein ACREBA_07300 [Nitrosotalea sp.]
MVILSAFLIISINLVFAQTDNNSVDMAMKLSTGHVMGTDYENGTFVQTIYIDGNVGTIQIGQPVFIKIFKNDSLYKTDLITAGNITSDKLFHYDITVVGKSNLDSYYISFTYGNQTVKEPLTIVHAGVQPIPYSTIQLKNGIIANKISCKSELHLIIKSEDGSPACVTPHTANILIERGWGHLP